MEPTPSNSGSSTTSPQSKYLSERSFSITLIIFHKATASQRPNVPHSHATWQLEVGLGLGIPTLIIVIGFIRFFLLKKVCSSSEVTCCISSKATYCICSGCISSEVTCCNCPEVTCCFSTRWSPPHRCCNKNLAIPWHLMAFSPNMRWIHRFY
jgi:hypothetical protein